MLVASGNSRKQFDDKNDNNNDDNNDDNNSELK